MSLPRLQRIEAQDPEFPRLRRQIVYQVLLWSLIVVLGVILTGALGLALAPMIAAWVIANTLLMLHHRTQIENFMHYRQLEALASIHALIAIRQRLPPMRLWAVSPDFAALLAGTILYYKPNLVVELGSGASTLISGYCLEKLGTGRVVAFDHALEFAESTHRAIKRHGLESFASIIHAPLTDSPHRLNDEVSPQWYATQDMRELKHIDLVVIDGPSGQLAPYIRYPALPELFDKLADGALILVDDAMRNQDHEVINRWLDEFDLEILERHANEKGAVLLRKLSQEETAGDQSTSGL